jgi:hypothetical protein
MRENQQNFAIKLENYKNPGEIVSGLGSAQESANVSVTGSKESNSFLYIVAYKLRHP